MSYCEKEGSDGRKRLWVGFLCVRFCPTLRDVAEWYVTKTASTATLTLQLEEEIQEDLKWCVEVKHVLHSGKSDFQTMELIQSGPFGKVCVQYLLSPLIQPHSW